MSDQLFYLFDPQTDNAYQKEDYPANCQAIEAALRMHPVVEDCVVLIRADKTGQQLISYIVVNGPFQAVQLHNHLLTILPDLALPVAYVPVATLHLTQDGKIDLTALSGLPVVDKQVVDDVENHLQQVLGMHTSAVIVEEPILRQVPIHLSDLLTEWHSSAVVEEESVVQLDALSLPANIETRPPAWSDGGPLIIHPDEPKTFTEALLRTAERYPERGIVIIQTGESEEFLSYPDLISKARQVTAGLYAQGLKPGDAVILQVELLRDHFIAFWGCVFGGIRPVIVAIAPTYTTTNAVVNKLYNIWKLLKQPPLLCNTSLKSALIGLETVAGMSSINVIPIETLHTYHPTDVYMVHPEDVIFYQLSAGSTGASKCIQETHRAIIAHVHGAAQYNNFTAEDVTINWLPMDHVVPTLTYHLKDVYLGRKQVHVRTDVVLSDPLIWFDLIEKHRGTQTWSPNFGYKLISDRLALNPERHWDLSSIKFFLNAGEQVTLPVVREFLKHTAPFGVQTSAMQPSFGMAEVCTCMTYENDFNFQTSVHRVHKASLNGMLYFIDDEEQARQFPTTTFIQLGPPMPGVQIRITDEQNQVVPEGVIGYFQIKGDVVMPGYLYNDDANRESFVGDGWFNSGDLGYIRNGRLTLTGRAKEMIIVRGANFYCYEIEDLVNTMDGVETTFVGASAVADPETGTEGLAIFFVPRPISADKLAVLIRTIRREVGSQLGLTPKFVIPLKREEFGKTTSGKIQRAQMRKSLEAGKYRQALKDVDLLLENSNTLPDWFFRKTWQRCQIRSTGRAVEGPVLIMGDGDGLADELIAELERQGRSWVRVQTGTDFARVDTRHYRLTPHVSEHYQQLFTSLRADQLEPRQLVHLWSYASETTPHNLDELLQAQQLGTYSLLALTHALNQIGQKSVALLVVSQGLQAVEVGETSAFQHAPMLGLLQTLPQEIPGIKCRHIDLPAEPKRAVWLCDELSTSHAYHQVAYRQGQRWTVNLEKANLPQLEKKPLPFKTGGLYLLTGGLGGIGELIAANLLQRFDARLLIMGRSPLIERQSAYQTLAELGQIIYVQSDVADLESLRQAVAQAEKHWNQPLHGVVHCAGLYHDCLLTDETPQTLAEVLQPKVQGTWQLHELLRDRPDVSLILFSSVLGHFGGSQVGAYAAANSFLDAFTAYRIAQGYSLTYCHSWSNWDDVGLSHGYAFKEQSRARGYQMLTADQGINSFVAALHAGPGNWLIGLDATKRFIRRWSEQKAHSLEKLVICVDGEQKFEVSTFPAIFDRFGVPIEHEFRFLPQMPRTPDGEIDRAALLQAGRKQHSKDFVAPQNAVEILVAEFWIELLGIKKISTTDDFFEIGGDSLLATQLLSRLRQTFQMPLHLRSLVEKPTLAGMAEMLVQNELQPGHVEAIAFLHQQLAGMSEDEIRASLQDRQMDES